MPVVLDAHDLERHHVAFVHHLLWVADAAVHQFRYVYEALDWPGQPGEGAECHELRHDTGHHITNGVLGDQVLPLFRRGSPDRKRDLLRLLVHLHDVDLDLVTDPEALLRVGVAVPRQLGKVSKTVGAAEVNEDAEVPDRGDPACADLAFLQFIQQPVLLL